MLIVRRATVRVSRVYSRSPSATTMKFRNSVVSAAAVLGCCAVPLKAWSVGQRQSRWISGTKNRVGRAPWNASPVSLTATLTTQGEAAKLGQEAADASTETLMARGTLVSFSRGGLASIRIDEENLDAQDEDGEGVNENVIGPDQFKKKFSSDAGGDLTGHQVKFPNGQKGVVVAHRPPIAFVYGGLNSIEGQEGAVSVFKEMMNVPITQGSTVLGWDGTPIDGGKSDEPTAQRAMFAPIPQVKDIALINNPMLTGNTMVDVLAPIGQGQNMILVADDLEAARGMVCDFISTGKQSGGATKFVYAAIDNSGDVVDKLSAAGVADDVHVVISQKQEKESDEEGASKAAEATAVAASACAIAESYALEQGMNTVVIVDTLDYHKQLWDATTRVLVDVFGADAVVKSDREGGASSEMRGFFSSIIQRAGQYKESRGGGSVTLLLICELPKLKAGDEQAVFLESDFENDSEKVKARIQLLVNKNIPLTAANLRRIDIPIPSASEGKRRLVLQHIDDLISMSDGQIWLDESLREKGQYPPIDPQRSITRVGIGADTESRADAPALRRIAEGLRLALSQAANMEGAEDTVASKKQLRTRNALLLAMHQVEGRGGRALSESCTVLLAAWKNFLDDAVDEGKTAGTDAGQKLIDDMLDHVQKVAPSAMATIDQTLDLPEDTEKEIMDAINSFFS